MTPTTPADEPAIEVAGLTRSFRGHLGIGATRVVDELGFTVRRGEVFGLLGPNGAGKTTTIKMLLGLLRADAGSIRVLGEPPSSVAARARLGFLPESPYFYDYLTAEEFLDFYARLRGVPRGERAPRVRSALQRVGLGDRAGTPLRRMSKGMLQRLGLAQAIQHDPELVILDEPMSGLDPIGRRDVRDLILSLAAEGRTILFSSHILQDAELLCDRVAILQRGRLRWSGELGRLGSQRVRWFEVAVRGAVPDTLPGERLSAVGEETLLRVADVEELTALLSAARQAQVQVLSIWPRRDTLEDLFLRELGVDRPARSA